MQDPSLSGAYALDGPEACRRLYADWAETYDADFAAAMDFRLPAEVALALTAANPPEGPILDVGAGTGLVAEALRALDHRGPIDGVDLSRAMLDVAGRKGLYRDLIEADITRPLPRTAPGRVSGTKSRMATGTKPDDTRYAGIVSSGTFTHGHVGPEALGVLLDAALPGGVFVLSVNAGVWAERDFDGALEALAPRIRDVTRTEVPIYGDKARQKDPDHAQDTALILRFRAR